MKGNSKHNTNQIEKAKNWRFKKPFDEPTKANNT